MRWTSQAGRGFVGPMTIANGMLLGGGYDRKVYAIDLATGASRWTSRVSGAIASGLLRDGDRIYTGTARPDGKVYALKLEDGRQLWRSSTGPVAAPLALIDGALIVQTLNGRVAALDPATGKIRWTRERGVGRTPAARAADGGIIIATTDSLLELDPKTGAVRRRDVTPGEIVAAWLDRGDELVAATTDSTVVAIGKADFKVRWSAKVDAPITATPTTRGDTLIVVTRIGSIYAIPLDGRGHATRVVALRWPATSPPAVYGDRLLLGGADGTVRALDAAGEERWHVTVWRPVDVAPIVLDDGFVAVGGNGDLHRYEP